MTTSKQLTNTELYERQLKPWAIVRLDDDLQRPVVQRFRKRCDADDFARVLARLEPAEFEVVYDPKPSV